MIRKAGAVLILALTSPVAAQGAAERGLTHTANSQPLTFVLAGQSNMAGAGPVPSVAYPANPHVSTYTADGWKTTVETELPGYGGASPAVSFAHRVWMQTGRDVHLVPCAVGATGMSRWVPTGDLYRACVAKVRSARVKTVSGVLFFQGEYDSIDLRLARVWGTRFGRFVSGVRRSFGRPLLPVVYAQIGSYDHDPQLIPAAWRMVKNQQAAFKANRVEMIRSDDLQQLPGTPHFTTASYRTLGVRFASAWLDIVGSSRFSR